MAVLQRIYDRVDRQSGLMAAMLERMELTYTDAGRMDLGISLSNACRACVLCRRSDACEAWLSGGRSAGEAPDFCPNASFLRRISAARRLQARDQ